MAKVQKAAQLTLGPVPSALIACGNQSEQNIITLAWVGVVNSSPPMISVAIRPERYSHDLVKDSGEFTINLPTKEQAHIVDGCGTLSGNNLDKFSHFKLTAEKGTLQFAPVIKECPISMECRVEQTLTLESHSLFIGRVVSTYLDEEVVDHKGKIDLNQVSLLGFFHGNYLETRPLELKMGYTIK
ncbi:MAG: flavin reductase family protein [Bacillota bacterium]